MNFDPRPYQLLPALGAWVGIVLALFGVLWLIGSLVSVLRGGKEGFFAFQGQIKDGLLDFVRISPKRIAALAGLAFRESIRKKALLVFVVFGILFLFANWFLSGTAERADAQVQIYVEFVLRTIKWITLLVMTLLACWSLPEDIRARSLHTVITKPARRNEVLMGRMLGLIGVATAIVLLMAAVGYVWIVRVTPETAKDQLVARVPVYGDISFTDDRGRPTIKGKNVGDLWDFRSYVSGNTLESAIWRIRDVTPSRIEKPLGDVLAEEAETLRGEASVERDVTIEDVLKLDGELGEDEEFLRTLRDESPFTYDFNRRRLLESEGQDARVIEIETGFEVFRTFKGKIGEGIPARIQLVNRYRRDYATELARDLHFVPVYDAIAGEGDFAGAAEQVETIAQAVEENTYLSVRALELDNNGQPVLPTGTSPVTAAEYRNLKLGHERAAQLLENLRASLGEGADAEWLGQLQETHAGIAQVADSIAGVADSGPENVKDNDRAPLAEGFTALADIYAEHADELNDILTDRIAELPVFEVKEYEQNNLIFTPQLEGAGASEGDTLNLYDDLVRDGVLTIEVFCQEPQQLIGMARPDLFIRTEDRPFAVSFAKSVFGIWLTVSMVIILAVTASTFVKGPVALILVALFYIIGSTGARLFVQEFVTGQIKGGGPIEAIIRLVTHKNPQVPLDEGLPASFAGVVDPALIQFVKYMTSIIPNFQYVNMQAYTAKGFDVPWNAAILPALVTFLGLLIPCLLLGHFSLKLREIETK